MSKKNVILDLDETLLNAQEKDRFNFRKYSDKLLKHDWHEMDGYYIIFERPNLQEFLDWLFENFNVSVFTAASKDYAIFIVNNIIMTPSKPERKLDYLLFSYHVEHGKKINNNQNSMKDLSMLWNTYKMPGYNQDNTVIIDDYNEVYKTNTKKGNKCYKIKPFNVKSKHSTKDSELLKVKEYLEEWK